MYVLSAIIIILVIGMAVYILAAFLLDLRECDRDIMWHVMYDLTY